MIVVPMLAKLSYERPFAWHKHVGRVQQIINSTEPRSTRITTYKLLTRVEMRLTDCNELKDLMQEIAVKELDEAREKYRQTAKENIKQLQEENKKAFDLKRKQVYKINDLVAIKRTQYGEGLMLKGKFLGPCKIVAVKDHGRCEVERIGDSEDPFKTSTVFEFMKPRPGPLEANEQSGRPNVGLEIGGFASRRTRSGLSYLATHNHFDI